MKHNFSSFYTKICIRNVSPKHEPNLACSFILEIVVVFVGLNILNKVIKTIKIGFEFQGRERIYE